jgi:hypothetical protein
MGSLGAFAKPMDLMPSFTLPLDLFVSSRCCSTPKQQRDELNLSDGDLASVRGTAYASDGSEAHPAKRSQCYVQH